MFSNQITNYMQFDEMSQIWFVKALQDEMQKRFSNSNGQKQAGQFKHIKTNMNCWLWMNSLMNEYKQFKRKISHDVAVDRKSKNINFLLHRVVFIARHDHDVIHITFHLCDNSAYFNSMHIMNEIIKNNNRRKSCKGDILYFFHEHTLMRQCQHNFFCIEMQSSSDDVSYYFHNYFEHLFLSFSMSFVFASQFFGSFQL